MMIKKFCVSALLVLGGFAIFVFGSPYYSMFPTNGNQRYYVLITAPFLTISIILKRNQTLAIYQPAAYALFVASTSLLFLSTGILNLHIGVLPPLMNLALDKFSQFLHVVPVIIGFTLLAGGDLKSIFISRGNLKRGLIFGLVSFAGFTLLAILLGV